MKWPISFIISLFFWKLSCTIHCVQFKCIFFLSESPLSHACLSLASEEDAQRPAAAAAVLGCMHSVLFWFCVVNWYLKNKTKKTTKTTTTVYRLKKKLLLFILLRS